MIRRPPRSTRVRSSAASDVYKRQLSPLPHRDYRRVARQALYMSEPGVVRISPVSSQVLRPDRIIGHPPYRVGGASSRSWSWVRISWHESPTCSIAHVMRVVPCASSSALHIVTTDCTSRRGGSTPRFSPRVRSRGARGWLVVYVEPGVQSEVIVTPKLYFVRISGSVIACQSRSGGCADVDLEHLLHRALPGRCVPLPRTDPEFRCPV